VYFSDEITFLKAEVKVRIGIKENTDPVPLCYCFEYTRADIRRDIAQWGETEIPERIKFEVENGFCACETKNPSGRCCLGDINGTIKDARSLSAK